MWLAGSCWNAPLCFRHMCMWICSLMVVLVIPIYMFNRVILFYVQMFLEYVRLRALHGFLEIMHTYTSLLWDSCLLVAREFLKIQHWLHVLRFVSEFHICSCYLKLFLHAFHESAGGSCTYGILGSASICRLAFWLKSIYSYAIWVTVLANCSLTRAVCGDQSFPLYTHIPFCEYFFSTCTLIKYILPNLYRII